MWTDVSKNSQYAMLEINRDACGILVTADSPVQKPDDILVIHSIFTPFVPNAPPTPTPAPAPRTLHMGLKRQCFELTQSAISHNKYIQFFYIETQT
jgi:hypothetical protein